MSEEVDTVCPQGHVYLGIDGEGLCKTCRQERWASVMEEFVADVPRKQRRYELWEERVVAKRRDKRNARRRARYAEKKARGV